MLHTDWRTNRPDGVRQSWVFEPITVKLYIYNSDDDAECESYVAFVDA